MSATPRPILFVHSSFRTGSTWLWSRFRHDPAMLAYCEVFNEQLGFLSFDNICDTSTVSWNSHHPATAPYFLEFIPLLQCGGGVSGYEPAMAIDRFFPEAGAGGDLSPAESDYIAGIIAAAAAAARIPVLTCTRTLARLQGLRRAVGGFHIVLTRNLAQQWFSYSHQFRTGNPYFIDRLMETIAKGGSDPAIRILQAFVAGCGIPPAGPTPPNDDIFIVFMALHLYLYAHSLPAADYVLDITRLAQGGAEERARVEAELAAALGLRIVLDGAADIISPPWRLLGDRRRVALTIDMLVQSIDRAGGKAPSVAASGAGFLREMWSEYDAYIHYAGGLHGLTDRAQAEPPELEPLRQAHAAAVARGEGLTAELAAAQVLAAQQIAALEAERDGVTADRARIAAELEAIPAEMAAVSQPAV